MGRLCAATALLLLCAVAASPPNGVGKILAEALAQGWTPLLPSETDGGGGVVGGGGKKISAALRMMRQRVAVAQSEMRELKQENQRMAEIIRGATSLQATTGRTGDSP